MLIVMAAIKLDSKGPIFYRQERTGRNGKSYFLWKFRSMRTDAEKNGAVWARSNDDRVTRVGRFIRKTRIDEIPQVSTSSLGDMSFVGPAARAPRVHRAAQAADPVLFAARGREARASPAGRRSATRYGASVEDARNKLEFDLYYVKNGSLMLDVGIIFHTVRHVLLARGAR